MTDTTAATNTTLWLPEDVWGLIASLLDNDELARFRQVCKLFNGIGSDAMLLQPLYNRLYAMDKTLPATLPTEGTALAFTKAFEMIQARQQQEIAYLTQYHPAVMAKPEYTQALQENSSVSLKSLEAKHALLDTVNNEIITARIDVNSTQLYLNGAHITRLPVTLFQAEGYVNFWKNLTRLDCSNNHLTALNVKGLVALEELYCYNNQLTALNVQGLAVLRQLGCHNNKLTALNVQGLVALQALSCYNNRLTALNVQGLVALQMLNCSNNQLTALNVKGLVALQLLRCDNNPLTDLNLTGVPAVIKNKYAELEKSLLFKQLNSPLSIQARREIITRLGADYTYKNCLRYCSVYDAAKLFISDSSSQVYNLASSTLSQFSGYFPSSANVSGNNSSANPQQKMSREEDQEQDDNQMEQEENSSATQEKESGDEPSAKRSKKS